MDIKEGNNVLSVDYSFPSEEETILKYNEITNKSLITSKVLTVHVTPNVTTCELKIKAQDNQTINSIRMTPEHPLIVFSKKDAVPENVHTYNISWDDHFVSLLDGYKRLGGYQNEHSLFYLPLSTMSFSSLNIQAGNLLRAWYQEGKISSFNNPIVQDNVYNLTIENTHNYIVEGILVHNK